jgi:LAGLIDADG endonuclease
METIIKPGEAALIHNNLDPWFITGLIDAEGSFMVILRDRTGRSITGKQIELVFQIKLHVKDIKVLELVQDYFGGIGRIEKKGSDASAFVVSSLKDIALKILPHFDNQPLKSQKQADYLLWRQVAIIMDHNGHRTNEGLQDIINLRASINFGLTDKLKS